MSSLNYCIKFELDVKDKNIVFTSTSKCKSTKSTELNGFEPSKDIKTFNALAGRPDQPLWHSSSL